MSATPPGPDQVTQTEPTPTTANTPALVTAPPTPTTGPSLTRFRLRGDCVLDFPLPTFAHTIPMVASVWPDARQPHGWARDFWELGPQGRGFIVPMIDLGDIIQFTVQHGLAAFTQWHGYLHAINRDSLIIHGPYASAASAYAAAQLALVHPIHTEALPPPDPHLPPTGIHLPHVTTPPVTTTIGQPPASVSVTFHGPQTTVGAPWHGWLVVDTAPLLAAMARPAAELTGLLRDHVPALSPTEAPVVLAALAAYHRPDALTLPTSRTEPTAPETTEPPDPSAPDPEPDGPEPSGPDQPPRATVSGPSIPDGSL